MKKLLFLFLFAASFYSVTAQNVSPTKEETLIYLKSKLALSKSFDQINEEGIIRNETMDYDGVSPVRIRFLKYKDITDVEYLKSGEDWRLILSGSTFRYLYVEDGMYKKTTNPDKKQFIYKGRSFGKEGDGPVFEIYLSSSIAEAEIKKYVRALKHMATISGASLIKEDLF